MLLLICCDAHFTVMSEEGDTVPFQGGGAEYGSPNFRVLLYYSEIYNVYLS